MGTIGGDSGSPKRVGYPKKRVGGGTGYKRPGGGPYGKCPILGEMNPSSPSGSPKRCGTRIDGKREGITGSCSGTYVGSEIISAKKIYIYPKINTDRELAPEQPEHVEGGQYGLQHLAIQPDDC